MNRVIIQLTEDHKILSICAEEPVNVTMIHRNADGSLDPHYHSIVRYDDVAIVKNTDDVIILLAGECLEQAQALAQEVLEERVRDDIRIQNRLADLMIARQKRERELDTFTDKERKAYTQVFERVLAEG